MKGYVVKCVLCECLYHRLTSMGVNMCAVCYEDLDTGYFE